MNLIDRAWQWLNIGWSAERRNAWLRGDDEGISGDAGVVVTEGSAMTYAAVFACVRVISETIAGMPWHVYQKEGRNRVAQPKDPADWVLSMQPNGEQNAFEWRETVLADALLGGHHYSEIERDNSGRLLALWPMDRNRVDRIRNQAGELRYRVKTNDGYVLLEPSEVYHVQGPMGMSPIMQAARSIGLGVALDKHGAAFFGNGTHPSGLLTTEGKLTADQIVAMREQWENTHKGPGRAHKTAILQGGVKWEALTLPNDEAQFLESRQFQVEEICRWYRVPPHKVGSLTRATWGNIEHQSIEFVTDCLVPWVQRMEHEANTKLFGRNLRGVRYSKLNVSALLRGDMKARFEAYAQALQNGWMSPNEVRELEDQNPYTGGDTYGVNAAWLPVDLLRKKVQAEIDRADKAVAAPPAAPAAAAPTAEPPTNVLPLARNA